MNANIGNDINKKVGRKKDTVRNYYICKNGKLCCTFENCKKEFALKTSVISLKHHINDNHIQDKNKDILINNIQMTEQNVEEIMMYQNYAIAFAKNSLPHCLIEDHYFRKATNCSNKYIFTKSKLREFIITEGEKVNKNTIDMICLNNLPVTIAIDGWTNVRMNKVTNILLICSGISYFYASIENKFNNNTAGYLVPILSEKIKYLMEKGMRIVAITTDNEYLMKLTRQQLNKIHPILIIVPCSAHIFQLCFKSICQIENIKKIIDETYGIINSIRNNKDNRLRLLELQKNDGIEDQLKILYSTEIRWISLISCIERLYVLKKYIIQLNVIISTNYWNNLDKLYELMNPFKSAIDKIQRDDASLYSVWLNFNNIMVHYQSINIVNYFENEKKGKNKKGDGNEIITIMEQKWNAHINNQLIDIVRLLNLEQNFKYDKQSLIFFVKWGRNYLITYNLIKCTNDDKINNYTVIENTIKLQLNEFILRHDIFATVDSENEKMKDMYKMQNKKYNIKLLWNLYTSSHYELSKIAVAILSICPSEASVERSFSMQSDVHSLERNKLSEELIEAEMNIKINLKD